jgi:hypothetical protein
MLSSPPTACANCDRPARVLTQGRCPPCYQHWHRYGRECDPGAAVQGQACVDCGQPTLARYRVRCLPCAQQPWQSRKRRYL